MNIILISRGLLTNSIGHKRTRMIAKYVLSSGHAVFCIVPDFDPVFSSNESSFGICIPVASREAKWIKTLMPFFKEASSSPQDLLDSELRNSGYKRTPSGVLHFLKKAYAKWSYVNFQCGSLYFHDNYVIRLRKKAFLKSTLKSLSHKFKDQTVLFTSVSPGYLNLIGARIKKKFPNVFWVADYRDPIEDNHNHKSISSSLSLKKCDEAAFANADLITAASEGLATKLCGSATRLGYNIDRRCMVIYNGFEHSESETAETGDCAEKISIVYTGTLYSNQNVELFWKVISDECLKEKVRLIYAGSSYSRVERLSTSREGSIKSLRLVSHEQAICVQRGADLLLLLKSDEPDQGIMTGKFYEYLASNKPILVIGDKDAEFNAIAERIGGIYILPYEEEKIKEFLLDFASKQPFRFERDSQEVDKFNWNNLARNLLEEIKKRLKNI